MGIDRHRGKLPRSRKVDRHAREQRIRVYIKIKPDGNKGTSEASTIAKSESCLTFTGSTISLLHAPKRHQERRPLSDKASSGDSTSPQSVLQSSSSPTLKTCTNVFELSCDGIISPEANQEEVYSKIGISSECIDSCMYQGKNAAFVAYGPSGTGKSYTMFGDLENFLPYTKTWNSKTLPSVNRGIVMQSIYAIFKKADAINNDAIFTFHLEAVEIYNEKVIVLQQKQRVESFAESMPILAGCIRQRNVCSTGLNNQSSRSHCIITFTIQSQDDLSSGIKHSGTICFVDLAGSERCSRANTIGKHLVEGCAINKSLLSLGQVISSLQRNAENHQGSPLRRDTRQHVPWRQSKLTLILKEVLENSCSTCFVLCVSSRKEEGAETLSTLQFGSQLMNVRIRVCGDNRSHNAIATHASLKKSEVDMKRNWNGDLQLGPALNEGTLALVRPRVLPLRIFIFLILLFILIVQCLVVFL